MDTYKAVIHTVNSVDKIKRSNLGNTYDPRVGLVKYLPAEWHIYVLPKLRMGMVLG